jgi:hypothetical protein
MTKKKPGRPKKVEISVWDKKYYTLDPKRDEQAHRNLKEERIYKGYANLFSLAFGREPNQKDVGTLNKIVAGILDVI